MRHVRTLRRQRPPSTTAAVTSGLLALRVPIARIVLERGVIEREERYLERRFGEAYRAYCATVPRWF